MDKWFKSETYYAGSQAIWRYVKCSSTSLNVTLTLNEAIPSLIYVNRFDKLQNIYENVQLFNGFVKNLVLFAALLKFLSEF